MQTQVGLAGRPVARHIDNVKNEIEELIDKASQNATRTKEIAMRFGWIEPPTDGKAEPQAVPRGHLEEISAKFGVLSLIVERTRSLIEFIEEKV